MGMEGIGFRVDGEEVGFGVGIRMGMEGIGFLGDGEEVGG